MGRSCSGHEPKHTQRKRRNKRKAEGPVEHEQRIEENEVDQREEEKEDERRSRGNPGETKINEIIE